MHYSLLNLETMVYVVMSLVGLLTDRTQAVSLENVTSDSMDISYGVPQGSILGPLLFTL